MRHLLSSFGAHSSEHFQNDATSQIWKNGNEKSAACGAAESTVDLSTESWTHQLTKHLERVERELKSTLWLWKLWRMVRVVSGLSNCILVGMGNRHDINLDLNLSYLLDLTVFLGKHLEPESTDVLLVELHLDVFMLLLDHVFVVLLVKSESCLG